MTDSHCDESATCLCILCEEVRSLVIWRYNRAMTTTIGVDKDSLELIAKVNTEYDELVSTKAGPKKHK